jgi:hypothetical protein
MLAVHAVSGHEARGDGSFHVRLQKLLQSNGAVLSAPPHVARLPAKVLLYFSLIILEPLDYVVSKLAQTFPARFGFAEPILVVVLAACTVV